MRNGNDLTIRHWFSIRVDSSSGRSPLIDIAQGNRPLPNNRKVKVTVKGTPAGNLVIVPNPIRPNRNGKLLTFAHDPDAVDRVVNDRAGTVFQFKLGLPADNNVSVDGKVSIYDFVGNCVATDPISYISPSNAFKSDNRMYVNEYRSNILPSSWTADGQVYDYYIYWNGCTQDGIPVAPGVYRVVVMVIFTTSEGKQSPQYFVDMIGVRR
jgi:hypothetical protein